MHKNFVQKAFVGMEELSWADSYQKFISMPMLFDMHYDDGIETFTTQIELMLMLCTEKELERAEKAYILTLSRRRKLTMVMKDDLAKLLDKDLDEMYEYVFKEIMPAEARNHEPNPGMYMEAIANWAKARSTTEMFTPREDAGYLLNFLCQVWLASPAQLTTTIKKDWEKLEDKKQLIENAYMQYLAKHLTDLAWQWDHDLCPVIGFCVLRIDQASTRTEAQEAYDDGIKHLKEATGFIG